MRLEFEYKRDKQEILEDSQECSCEKTITLGNSLLIKGNNFYGLGLLLKNKFKNKIDLVYIDPPFNTSQEFFVSNNRCSTISRSKCGVLAYNDNFTLDEYLAFMRERFVLIYELLSEEGSLYVHIDTKMGHYVKLLLDEIFGAENFRNDITRIKSNPKNFNRRAFGNEKDIILFYTKNHNKNIWNNVCVSLTEEEIIKRFPKMDANGRYTTIPLHAPGTTVSGVTGQPWRGISPPEGRHWRTDPKEFDYLDSQGLIEWSANGNPRIKKYVKDHKGKKVQDVWVYKDPQYPLYPTQKNQKMIEFIIKQSSRECGIVLDCFAGGGTTIYACENTNRKWIAIDESEQSIKTIRENLPFASIYEFIDLSKY